MDDVMKQRVLVSTACGVTGMVVGAALVVIRKTPLFPIVAGVLVGLGVFVFDYADDLWTKRE